MASWKNTLSGTAGVLLVLGILIAVNVLIGQVRAFRVDLTEGNLYTLSTGTKQMLDGVERDVTLKFYFSASSEATPVQLKQYARRVRDLLGEYQAHGNGRVLLETYDPKPDSDEEQWAMKYGLAPQGGGFLGGDAVYLGLAAVSGANEAAIPFLEPRAEPRLEYLVTRLIYEVTNVDRPTIGILSSLPVMGMPQMPFARPPQPMPQKWMFVTELEKMYDVVEISPSEDRLPDGLTTLLMVHPKDLSDSLLYAVDQFLLRGGRVLAFVDPMCMADESQMNPYQRMMPPQSASDLNRLTDTWGVRLETDKVVSDLIAATQLRMGSQPRIERFPTWLSLREEQLDREEIATSSLEFLMMPFAGAFVGEPREGLEMATLVRTSDEAGLVEVFEAMTDSASIVNAMEKQDPLPVAIRIRGVFPSAFPDGSPKDGETDSADAEPAATEEAGAGVEFPAHLAEGSAEGVLVLVGDTDMLADQNCVQVMELLGQRFAQPMNDNLNFVLNLLEQLTGSEALIGLRSRGTYQRPFTKVIELQQTAQEKWQLEEQALQAKLQEVQSRLNQLQTAKQDDQQFILTPEQQAEIERYHQEVVNTRGQLREVRSNLRRDIEALGLKLKAINIFAVPLVVAVFGVARGVRRRKIAEHPAA